MGTTERATIASPYDRQGWDPVVAASAIAERAIADAPARDVAARSDPTSAFPSAIIADLHRAGLLFAPLPRALGGVGLGHDAGTRHRLFRTLVEVGRADLSAGRLYEGHVDALLLVAQFGTRDQQARVGRQVARGGLFGVWNTGPSEGGVRVTTDGKYVRFHGTKTFGSGAAHVAGAVVTAAWPDGGWQMGIIPVAALRRTGAARVDPETWHPLGMLGSASCTVVFRDACLPARSILGAPGDYYAQPRFTGGAARFAAVQLGGAERLVDALRAFLRETRRTDDPYQLARAGEAAMLVAGGRAWLRAAADVAEAHAADPATTDAATVTAHANMTRTAVQELCVRVCELVERSVGARGLLAPYPFAGGVRDLLMYLRQPAPDAAVADVGRHALARPASVGRLWSPA